MIDEPPAEEQERLAREAARQASLDLDRDRALRFVLGELDRMWDVIDAQHAVLLAVRSRLGIRTGDPAIWAAGSLLVRYRERQETGRRERAQRFLP